MSYEVAPRWQGLSIIVARLNRTMARCYNGMIWQELGRSRTERAIHDMKDGREVLMTLFVLRSGSTEEGALIASALGPWLDCFEAIWDAEHPDFQAVECIQILEDFVAGEPLSATDFQKAGRFVTALRDAAKNELLESSDPVVREMARINDSFGDIMAAEGPGY